MIEWLLNSFEAHYFIQFSHQRTIYLCFYTPNRMVTNRLRACVRASFALKLKVDSIDRHQACNVRLRCNVTVNHRPIYYSRRALYVRNIVHHEIIQEFSV